MIDNYVARRVEQEVRACSGCSGRKKVLVLMNLWGYDVEIEKECDQCGGTGEMVVDV